MRRTLACALVVLLVACRSSPPPAIADAEFRTLVETLSEPAGSYAISDNLVSNEPWFAENMRFIRSSGGVYVGVGPEQNFSYIAHVRPELAFVVDIRRENRDLHLLYKALFEISADRADFVARLFSRPRPPGLDTGSSAREIFDGFAGVRPSGETRGVTLALVRDRLIAGRGLTPAVVDFPTIDRLLEAFSKAGPDIHFWSSTAVTTDRTGPSYRNLMAMPDQGGQSRSFLADEDRFRFVKRLQSRNLIVPVVGDFAGPSALRRIGDTVRQRGSTISVFYASNVGVYLTSRQTHAYCVNLTTWPMSRDAAFVESNAVQPFAKKLATCGR